MIFDLKYALLLVVFGGLLTWQSAVPSSFSMGVLLPGTPPLIWVFAMIHAPICAD